MKISIISNLYPPHVLGGYELGCADLARCLWQAGHEVEVLTSKVAGQLNRVPALEDGPPVRHLFEPVFEYDYKPALTGTAVWAERYYKVFGGILPGNVTALLAHWDVNPPDVVWAFNLMGLGPLGMLEVLAYSGHRCVVHHMDTLDIAFAANSAWTARFSRAKRQVSAISCSQETRERNEVLGAYRTHHVIPNGVEFAASPVRKAPRSSGDGVYRFVHFGQVHPKKAVLELLHAVVELQKLGSSQRFELDIYGACHFHGYWEELLRFIADHQLKGCVHLRGPLPKAELLKILPEFDAAVMLLSDYEPFAYAPVEASEAGLPVIFPAAAGARECLPEACPLALAERLNPSATAAVMAQCMNFPGWAREQAHLQRSAFQKTCDLQKVILPSCLAVLEDLPRAPKIDGLESILHANSQMMDDYSLYRRTKN